MLSFFGPDLGTRNAKNLFGPFKVPNSNQKTAKLKKIFVSFKWLLRVLKGGRARMMTSAKNNLNFLSLYKHKKNRHPKLKRFFYCKLHTFTSF